MPLLGARRRDFAVPEDVAYFNTASLAPMLHVVREAGEAGLRRRSEPWTITTEDWFVEVEILRSLVGRLLGDDADGVALVPATSYGFAVAARNLTVPAGGRIVVLGREYPSGIYTWRALAARCDAQIITAARAPGQSWTDTIVDRLATLGLAPNPHQRGPHLLGVELPDTARTQILPALAGERCYAAIRGSSLRLSPHLHTTPADINRLIAALAQVTS